MSTCRSIIIWPLVPMVVRRGGSAPDPAPAKPIEIHTTLWMDDRYRSDAAKSEWAVIGIRGGQEENEGVPYPVCVFHVCTALVHPVTKPNNWCTAQGIVSCPGFVGKFLKKEVKSYRKTNGKFINDINKQEYSNSISSPAIHLYPAFDVFDSRVWFYFLNPLVNI